ncbi:cytochrome P450 [Mangrovimicrobium sediminis]|uniref:Cytochrome P450 n=1 Tax=Mangrovimicrobium sediminis TaxID=2562682 RepID=A0A4Z0LV74_9GAMM|nr:cytochrome P450 [Haliea sp. SAOS-164]TGD71293.1 cytochrome P450 [Haliea sp. SAOS-164]
MEAQALYYDQYSYDIDDNPYEIWKRLRDEAPVWYNEKYNYWVLSRYDDVLKASMDWQNFSSAWGTVLELMSENPGDAPLMINNDPPYHDQLRAVVAQQFTPASIAKLENDIRDIVLGYLQPLEGRDSFDFVQDFGRWIPMDVVSHILGIPHEGRRKINQWADDSLARDENGGMTEAGINAMGKAMGYFSEILEDRKANPCGDFLSYLTHAEIETEDGKRPFTKDESLFFMVLIASAGNETVARLLSNAGVLLARHPEQRQKLRDNPQLIPRAIEEMLRYEPPSPIQFRRLLNDVEMHGVTMKAGDNVALLTAAATRDDRHWDNPEVFDIERAPKRHVTFGYGPHTCLGSSVARLESKIALEEVLKRIPDWDVETAGLKRTRTSTVRGYSHVPIVIKR